MNLAKVFCVLERTRRGEARYVYRNGLSLSKIGLKRTLKVFFFSLKMHKFIFNVKKVQMAPKNLKKLEMFWHPMNLVKIFGAFKKICKFLK